eukprot:CAMPEP_0202966760 /NCGR_PEP_ID=MMETSP1396-20130829/11317_1 /ASSEMBLY_ACC=CAM_ASM_000872 /TAXON_ID= /ORGANISM="Pseudokeronopsis sp., Strain Brazil" /LENGTH=260 /DNA_ID=CAMNT_0049690993 /DNA_START=17 /DNA_END=799 /DNA_ORIENTATION=+
MAASITSTDIEEDKYSYENLLVMRQRFPGRQDEELARFLIARKNDVDKASAQLEKRISFESDFLPVKKIDCGNEFNPGKLYAHGTDKEGRPLLIWSVRNNIAAERDMEKVVKLLVWWVEYTARKLLPPNISKYTLLMDRSCFKQENADLDLMKHVSATLQDMYPERVKRIVIHPADLVFYTLWNIGKWFLDPVTREKVQPMLYFYGVEQFIDKKFIPRAMGGECDYVYNPDDFEDWDETPEKESEESVSQASSSAAATEG